MGLWSTGRGRGIRNVIDSGVGVNHFDEVNKKATMIRFKLNANYRAWRGMQNVGRTLSLGLLLLLPTQIMNAADSSKTEASSAEIHHATFGGGCFWCVEAVFERQEGVISVVSGYAGGKSPNPTYQEVCTGQTGHAEVVDIKFDASKITFDKLVDLFWKAHDPTTLNRQGADAGTQYRSVIFSRSDDQKKIAEESKRKAAEKFTSPIVTEIVPLATFYPAEEYHQDYFRKNPNAPYCAIVIQPKLNKLKKIGH